jgi:hypothetical protein
VDDVPVEIAMFLTLPRHANLFRLLLARECEFFAF